uniref:hypothetical protein n=1 Tax=Lactobacillus delbrueckii TaxID=1584 RepID=UPI0015E84F84|nr:hypothetical protein [Lactobacillus delbrueckii]
MDFKKGLKGLQDQQTRLEAKQEVLLDIMAEFWPKVAKEGNDVAEAVKVEDLAEWFAKNSRKTVICVSARQKTAMTWLLNHNSLQENCYGTMIFIGGWVKQLTNSKRKSKVKTLEEII